MPNRQNPPVTAEGLLDDLSSQIKRFLRFLEVDLTIGMIETGVTSQVLSALVSIS